MIATLVGILYVGLIVLFALAEHWFDDDDDNPTPA